MTSPTYSPTVEREDPFNLSNFFPSHFGFGERDEEWKWLQDETSHTERSPARSGYSTPFAEDDAWLPPTPPDEEMHEESLDEELTEATIQKEDKLGILTFGGTSVYIRKEHLLMMGWTHAGGFLASKRTGDKYSEDQLISPYSEYDLTDDEALYHALSALRTSRGLSTEPETTKQVRAQFDELFVTEAAESVLEGLNDGGYSLWHGGVRGAMDFFDTKF